MATRSQIQIEQEGITFIDSGKEHRDPITLYHHWDGYPSNIVPLLKKAEANMKETWQAGRSGKSASYIIAADVAGYEPQGNNALQGDIEYLYKIYCMNHTGGSINEKAQWEIEIYTPKAGFWDDPTIENMTPIIPRQPLQALDI